MSTRLVDVRWVKGAVDAGESNSGQKRTAPQHGQKYSRESRIPAVEKRHGAGVAATVK
jgi:hypothetical protein